MRISGAITGEAKCATIVVCGSSRLLISLSGLARATWLSVRCQLEISVRRIGWQGRPVFELEQVHVRKLPIDAKSTGIGCDAVPTMTVRQ